MKHYKVTYFDRTIVVRALNGEIAKVMAANSMRINPNTETHKMDASEIKEGE